MGVYIQADGSNSCEIAMHEGKSESMFEHKVHKSMGVVLEIIQMTRHSQRNPERGILLTSAR